ncbi:SDR family NAD(P)-dependent oxidoreductase, partial [Mannheimia haemolytica]
MNRLSGKKIVITGAASGIGQAAAKLMVAEGAHVLIADLDREAAESAAATIGRSESGGRAIGTEVDVMD